MAIALNEPAPSSLADDFRRDGLAIIDLGLSNFDEISDRLIGTLSSKYDATHRIESAWRISDDVRNLATLPKVMETLRTLYGREAFPFQTLNFDRGTQQAIHSDTIHFDSSPAGFMGGVWIALEDIDEDNGPLIYYPGSQTMPQLTLKDFGVPSLKGQNPYDLYRTVYEPGIANVVKEHDLKPMEAHLRKGQALIWSANLLHGGKPILNPSRTRHTQVTHYYFEGCSYHTPLLSDDDRGPYRRYPVDIRTGRNVGGEVDGKPIPVPLKQRVGSWAKSTLRSGTRHQR
jgi:hypothetical protein